MNDPFQLRPRITERRSFVELRWGFDRRSGQDRRKAEWWVANLGTAEARETLTTLTTDQDSAARQAAAGRMQ
ncbi:MAG: hypothetical protein GTN62_01580 [Gemmatimonadales bacterium]|nr:hypothetical protein [Gemmatimonadales bacterium]NIN48793.1 hypothetical protein [Gemmatimonadales bacterium]NIP06257.1 hypothetical protein [Gemmatimonadales bacterium]NIR00144.1 hypothetical protein [Gemmatimonadales bacterium]NIS64547.1 hypothetical protein [Gemmatimonadales bacterium]